MNKIVKIVIVIAIIAALSIGGYVLFRSIFEQREFMDVASEVLGQAAGLGTQAADYVKANIPTVVAAGGTVTALGGVALSKINRAKQQATDINTAATSAIDAAKTEKAKAFAQFEDAKAKLSEATTKVADVQQQFNDYKVEIEPKLNEVKNLEVQVQSAKDENAQFVMNLMSAANGALVTNPVDGKVYSVLKTPPEIHIK